MVPDTLSIPHILVPAVDELIFRDVVNDSPGSSSYGKGKEWSLPLFCAFSGRNPTAYVAHIF